LRCQGAAELSYFADTSFQRSSLGWREKKTCAKLNFKIPQQQLILPNDAVSALLRLNSGLMRKIGAWQILGVWLPNWR
jgi:hypothetical protein